MQHYTKAELRKHLAMEHNISPLSIYLQEIVYGGIDGIVTTFAVVAGFAGAQSGAMAQYGYMTVLLFGLANLFADAFSMGLGNFLSIRSEQDRYYQERAKELAEIKNNPDIEKAETHSILTHHGFTREQADQLIEIYAQNPKYWANFMMQYELQIADPEADNPVFTSLATFVSFQVFGVIPLLPYIMFGTSRNVFLYAIIATACAMIFLGILRYRVTKHPIVRSIGGVLTLGSISASIAYIVGVFFRV